MSQDTIKCPKCGEIIKVSEVLSHDMEVAVRTRLEKEWEGKLMQERQRLQDKAKKDAMDAVSLELTDLKEQVAEKSKKLEESKTQELELRKRERQIQDKEATLKSEYESRERSLKEALVTEKKQIEDRVKKELEAKSSVELDALKEQVQEQSQNLEKARHLELELRKQQRTLEEDKKAFELEMARKIDSERQQIMEKAGRDIEEQHKFKDAEKDKQLMDMRKQIEELKRKAEQGSQQAQGEVLELALEQMLKENFPFDEVAPVSKGVKGADVVHTVKTQAGRVCGKILWETKRTKAWSDGWIQKLKDDQREEKADLSVIVSEVLPKNLHHFRQIDGVWVTDIPSSFSLALALRVVLTQVAKAQDVQTGKEEKKEIVYNYLTGTEFKNRIQAIVESFVAMKNGLDAEKRDMEKIWSKREKQIERITLNIAGMHGDIEGIVGSSLPAVKILELSEVSEITER